MSLCSTRTNTSQLKSAPQRGLLAGRQRGEEGDRRPSAVPPGLINRFMHGYLERLVVLGHLEKDRRLFSQSMPVVFLIREITRG